MKIETLNINKQELLFVIYRRSYSGPTDVGPRRGTTFLLFLRK